MSSDILEMVIHRIEVGLPAQLHNYRRGRIAGESYPGMIREHGGEVAGCLYQNLVDEDFRKLDEFEGKMYQRVLINIELPQPLLAYTYLLADDFAHLLTDREWSYDDFLINEKENFIRTYGGWY